MPSLQSAATAPLLTGQVARLAGVSEETIREWTRTGKLPAQRTAGGYRLYDPAVVSALLAKRAQLKSDAELAAVR